MLWNDAGSNIEGSTYEESDDVFDALDHTEDDMLQNDTEDNVKDLSYDESDGVQLSQRELLEYFRLFTRMGALLPSMACCQFCLIFAVKLFCIDISTHKKVEAKISLVINVRYCMNVR